MARRSDNKMPQENLFGSALADLYSRGFDISRDNPWALAQSAFPTAQRIQPGITMADVLSQARDYLGQGGPQPPRVPASPSAVSFVPPVQGQDEFPRPEDSPGETGPVGMSSDTGLGGRASMASAIGRGSNPVGPANLALSLMGLALMGTPLGPVLGALKYAANRHNEMAITDAMGIGPPGSPAPAGTGQGVGIGPPGSVGPGGNIGITGVPTGMAPGNLGEIGIVGGGTAPGVGPGIGGVAGVPGGTGPGGAPGAAGPGSEGSTGVGDASGPGGSAGAPSGAGDSGTSDAFKKGGFVKDTRKHGKVVPIKAHAGEFVMNPRATDAFHPVLEAMNALVPQDPKRFEQLMDKARKFFDV